MPAKTSKTAEELKAEAMGRAGSGTRGASRPPRASGAGPAPQPAADVPPVDDEPRKLTPTMRTLREGVLDVYTGAQMMCYMFDPFSAEMIGATKHACADAWIELAERDKRVAAFLKRITTGSAWGGVIMAHLSMVLPILARKGIVPGGALFGGGLMNAIPDPPSDADMEEFAAAADAFARQGFVTADQNGHGA